MMVDARSDGGRSWLSGQDLWPDNTGGLGRANLYQLNGRILLLCDYRECYQIDHESATRVETRGGSGKFLGSFDEDAAGSWRFLTSAERPEIPLDAAAR